MWGLASPGRLFILSGLIMMFHLDGQVGFDARQRGQDVIQDLLCRHPKGPGLFQPSPPVGLAAVTRSARSAVITDMVTSHH